MASGMTKKRSRSDLLLGSIVLTAASLGVILGSLALYWRPAPVLAALPWYAPLMISLTMLAALGIAFLAFGRYRVLQGPVPFWVGLAFSSYAVLSVFYVLSFPGLLPDQQGLIAKLPNTASWLMLLMLSALAISLLIAAVSPWPGPRMRGDSRSFQKGWFTVATLAAVTAVGGLSMAFEQVLPLLTVQGTSTPLLRVYQSAFIITLGAASVLAAYRYRQTGDLLLGHVALVGLVFGFSALAGLLAQIRYDAFWYVAFVLRVGGVTAMLFGLLSEYVALYRREREKTGELAEIDRLKDQFIDVAAHELKTPVTIMKGYAQFLRRMPDGTPAPRQLLDAIDHGADRLTGIVNDLLDISRLQAGQLELARERVDLPAIVRETVDRLALTTEKHHFRLVRADPAFVQGDPNRLENVVANLVDNAVRYSPRGGNVDVAVSVEGREATVSISDAGVGIPEEKQARMFQRFYRAHTGTPHDYGGMGVGLHICNEIVGRHGGRMWFESEEGKGSTFYFTLPVAV